MDTCSQKHICKMTTHINGTIRTIKSNSKPGKGAVIQGSHIDQFFLWENPPKLPFLSLEKFFFGNWEKPPKTQYVEVCLCLISSEELIHGGQHESMILTGKPASHKRMYIYILYHVLLHRQNICTKPYAQQ